MTELTPAQIVHRDLERIREQAPLVHNITNYVVMNSTANALLAVGASPVMAHAVEEVEDMVGIAKALVINIGTLSPPWIESMRRAMRAAQERHVPVVLDPVGAGATKLRTDTARELLEEAPITVLRGNASEILAVHSAAGATKGVDSSHEVDAAAEAARDLARKYDCVVSVSGAIDLLVDASTQVRIANGDGMMTTVTGLGCTASALTGAFLGVDENPIDAAAAAMVTLGLAGERAAKLAEGPGSLQMRLLDELHHLHEVDVDADLRWEVVP